MVEDIGSFLAALPVTDSCQASYDVFRCLYKLHTPYEWVQDTSLIMDVCDVIARRRPDLMSVGIRLNVQVNLFLRTCYDFGDKDQFERLCVDGSTGCFALTEAVAGVLSGLRVDVGFRCEDGGAYTLQQTAHTVKKQYISQAPRSDVVLLFACNVDNKRDVRVFSLRKPVPGLAVDVMAGDQHARVDGLDLGVLRLTDDIRVPGECVLAGTVAANRLEILNGIIYGRACIARATISGVLGLVDHCRRAMLTTKLRTLPNLVHCLDTVQEEAEELYQRVVSLITRS